MSVLPDYQQAVYEAVAERSDGRCEAMVRIGNGVWTRCGRANAQIHHMLKRGRGGELLDRAGETYHLLAVCYIHHMYAEESGEDTDMLIDGYVISDPLTGRPVYTGSDAYLTALYGGRSDQ